MSNNFISDLIVLACRLVASACDLTTRFERYRPFVQIFPTVVRFRGACFRRSGFFAFALYHFCGIKLRVNDLCVCNTIDQHRVEDSNLSIMTVCCLTLMMRNGLVTRCCIAIYGFFTKAPMDISGVSSKGGIEMERYRPALNGDVSQTWEIVIVYKTRL